MSNFTSETKNIQVTAFRDKNNNPCCAKNFETGEVCVFYRSQRWGTHETCVFAKDDGKYSRGINRRGEDGLGSLIPLETCPVWPNLPEFKELDIVKLAKPLKNDLYCLDTGTSGTIVHIYDGVDKITNSKWGEVEFIVNGKSSVWTLSFDYLELVKSYN